MVIRKYKSWLMRPQNFFVVAATVFGLIFIFAIPPLHGNDEVVHFPRAYNIQEGHVWPQHLSGFDYGAHLPKQIKEFNDNYREQVQNPQPAVKLSDVQTQYASERLTDTERQPISFTSAAVYSAWAYTPPAAGIYTARMLNLPLNWYVYVGRLFALAAYIVLVYFALKYLPFGKIFLLVVALLPTALTQAATIGMDEMVNGLSWLIIALTLAVFTQNLKVTRKLLSLLLFLAIFLATTKQSYAPLAILPLVIPARLFPFSYNKVWLWRLFFGISLVIASLWYLGATSPIAEVFHHIQRPGLFVDEGAQLHYVFQHPLQFLGMIFVQPFTVWSGIIYAGLVGILTNKVIYIPLAMILLLLAALVMTLFHEERPKIAKRDRLFILSSTIVAFLATFFLINLALYLAFTQVGFYRVEGLQGRYFLPLLPLLGIILHVGMPQVFLKFNERLTNSLIYPVLLAGLASAVIVIH